MQYMDDPDDPELDEVLTKQLAEAKAAGTAPPIGSPIRQRYDRATERHRARQSGKPVPTIGLGEPAPEADLTAVLPHGDLRKSVATDGDASVQRAVQGQVEFLNQWARERQLQQSPAALTKALAELNTLRERLLAKSADGKPVTFTITPKKGR